MYCRIYMFLRSPKIWYFIYSLAMPKESKRAKMKISCAGSERFTKSILKSLLKLLSFRLRWRKKYFFFNFCKGLWFYEAVDRSHGECEVSKQLFWNYKSFINRENCKRLCFHSSRVPLFLHSRICVMTMNDILVVKEYFKQRPQHRILVPHLRTLLVDPPLRISLFFLHGSRYEWVWVFLGGKWLHCL